MKRLTIISGGSLAFLFPLLTYAQGGTFGGRFTSIGSLLNYLATNIFASLLVLGFMVAFLVFFWGVVVFIANAGNETKIKEGKKFLLWGIITLFVMMSIWGILNLLMNTFFGSGGGGGVIYF